jgi:hypothetical protein
MSSASRPITTKLISAVSAANADRLSDAAPHPVEARTIDTATGWDSYEVWRRFIKDARDRRRRHRDS